MCNINDIFQEDGILSEYNSSYVRRPSQADAAAMIEFALRNKQHFILQGPCGFGKSLCYLIPAIKNLIENNFEGQIVVVTSNISLQEQLINKDIPFVMDIMDKLYPGKKVKSIIRPTQLKGISNFLCMDKLEDVDFLNNASLIKDEKMEQVQRFYSTTSSGDLNTIDFALDANTKKNITCSTSNECKASLCQYKDECFYNKQKINAKASKLIVTNYHMLYSYKEIPNNQIFNNTNVYIFDEVHEAEVILREFTSNSITSGTVEYIERKVKEIQNSAGVKYAQYTAIDLERLKSASNTYFTNIQLMYKDKLLIKPILINSVSDLPDSEDFETALNVLITKLSQFEVILKQSSSNTLNEADHMSNLSNDSENVKTHSSQEDNVVDESNIITTVRSLISTCENTVNLITGVQHFLSQNNLVMYIESARNRTVLGVKSIHVSNRFRDYFLNDEDVTCILTSATISVDNNFDFLKRKLGIDEVDFRTMEYIGESPFDLSSQELWYIPENAVPGNSKEFDSLMPKQIEELIRITNGGALCLFTSNKNLNICKEYLREKCPDMNILVQGDMSKAKLLDEFRKDYNSTLLASKSFFTGVDVKGQSLRVVVIDKLPFETTTDPVQQKLSKNKDYFFKYSLPEMVISFKQAVGRGVRSIDDFCIISVLDSRLVDSNYSRKIISSFNYKILGTRDLEGVARYMELALQN